MTPTEDIQLQPARDGVIRSSAWFGRVEQLKADIKKLQAFIETLTPEERTGPLRTVNQVRAHAWGIALQMESVVLKAERPNAPDQRPGANCNVCGRGLVRDDELAIGVCSVCANEEVLAKPKRRSRLSECEKGYRRWIAHEKKQSPKRLGAAGAQLQDRGRDTASQQTLSPNNPDQRPGRQRI